MGVSKMIWESYEGDSFIMNFDESDRNRYKEAIELSEMDLEIRNYPKTDIANISYYRNCDKKYCSLWQSGENYHPWKFLAILEGLRHKYKFNE